MNYLQLANRVKSESARSGGTIASKATAFGDDVRIFGWLANAWVELQNETDWRWMRKSVEKDILNATIRYTPTNLTGFNILDLRRWVEPTRDYQPLVYQVSAPAYRSPLEWVAVDAFRRDFVNTPHQASSPQYWSVDYNDDLLIGPTPVGAWKLVIDYWQDVVPLVLDADVPAMPARFHEILVWRALMELASFDAATEVYSRAKANYDTIHANLRAEQGPKMAWRGRSLS